MPAASVRSVVIVGRDADAWLAALGLLRAVGPLGVDVRVVELPSRIGAHYVYSALPTLHSLHDLLGLREDALYRECFALPVLASRFVDWSPGGVFVHGFDNARPAVDGIDFLQFWVDARARGLSVPLEQFSLAAVAASQSRVDDTPGGVDQLGGIVPGLHLDAARYAALLRRGALSSGATVIQGTLDKVERDGDTIHSVTTSTGQTIRGELFIDASGDERILLKDQPGHAWNSWSQWLPCDRLLTGSLPPLSPKPSFRNVTAFRDGWLGLFPLANRTAVVASVVGHDQALPQLAQSLEALVGQPIAELSEIPYASGASARPWIGNCIAIGASIASVEPLDSGPLHLVQLGLANLIAQWPADPRECLEAAPFNSALAAHLEPLRDFSVAHYHLNRRLGEPLWDRARAAPPPLMLGSKLSLFQARGHVPMYDGESFNEQSWSASFVGHGLIPNSVDPRVGTVPESERIGKIRGLLEVVSEQVEAMPDVKEYIVSRSGR